MDEKTQATWSKLEIQSVARQEFDEPLKEIQKSIKECRNEAVTQSDLSSAIEKATKQYTSHRLFYWVWAMAAAIIGWLVNHFHG